MNKNAVFWIEALFAILSLWVLFFVGSYPEHALLALRIYVLALIFITLGLVLAVRYFQSQHSTIDIDRICDMVRRVDVPAFIWSNDLTTLYTNQPMDDLLGIGGSEDPGDNAVLLTKLFHSLNIGPRSAAGVLDGQSYPTHFIDQNGDYRYITWTTSMLKKGTKGMLFFTIGFETTELEETRLDLKERAEALAKSERRYALSMRLSGIGILLREDERDAYYASDEAMKFLGIDKNEISFLEFRRKIHKDDRPLFDDYLQSMKNAGPGQGSSRPQLLELRIRSDETEHYIPYAYHYHENLLTASGRPIIGGALIDISNEKQKDAIIERLAFTDEVTGIANRNKLMHEGDVNYRLCRANGTFGWIIVLDIDRFHIINDSFGYENGD